MKRNNSLLNVESILPEENVGDSMSPQQSPNVFHRRKLFSAENSFDMFSSVTTPTNSNYLPRNNSFDSPPVNLFWHSRFTSFNRPKQSQQQPPNYYQQLLIQEEEDRKRRELEKFLYETPPSYAAPPPPPPAQLKTNLESEIKSPTETTEELSRFLDSPTRTDSGRTLAKEFKFVYGHRQSFRNQQKSQENEILNNFSLFEPKIQVELQMTDETHENSSQIIETKPSIKNYSEFSLSIDEKYLKDNSEISPISLSTTDSSSPRSSSEPPKRRLAARRRITKNLDCSESECDKMVENDGIENVESESSTFCSPSASHSNFENENVENSSFDTLTTVALDSVDDYVIMGKGKFFNGKKEKEDIQSRPLPPTPAYSFDEPEDFAPETVYSTIDEEKYPTDVVLHQRSVSDHVLNPKKNNFDDDKIRKTNSDRTERRSAKMIENDDENIRKLSNSDKETRNLSCSTPIIGNEDETGKRRRLTTAESVTTPEDVGGGEIRRPRLTTSSGEGTLKLRDPSFNAEQKRPQLIQNLDNLSNEKVNHVSNHSITSLMDKFMSKRHISEPQIKMNQTTNNLSPKDSSVRRSFKWKSFIPGFKSTTENVNEKKSQESKKSGYSASFNDKNCTVKLRTSNLKEETQKLTTLKEKKFEEDENDVDDDDETFFHISKPPIIIRRSMERPWRGLLTKSFYGNLPKKSTDNLNTNMEENLKRRISVIGDVECDRKIYAPSKESNEKLDKILKEQFGEIPKIEIDDSFLYSSDDERRTTMDNLSTRNIKLKKSPRKKSTQTEKVYKTLPRKTGHGHQGFKTPTKTSQKNEDGSKTLPNGKVRKRKTRRGQILQKRKSINYALAAVSMMENDESPQKLTKQTISAVVLPGKSTTPNRRTNVKRFISSSAVSDINKPILKNEKEKKGTLNFLTRIGAGRKKSRDVRDLDLYGQMTTTSSPGPKSASLTFPFHGRQASSSSVLPDTLKFLTDAEKAATVGGYLTRSSSFGSIPNISPLCLEKQKWADLHLWEDESGSWQQKWQNVKLSDVEKKRQNVIFELYQTEKNHCQTLVFFQQAYQVGLKNSNILDDNQLATLIPDVLDSLLDFHLDFLRKMKERMAENPIVDKISDVLLQVFKTGEFKKSALNGYKTFCISQDECCQNYTNLMEKNQKFKRFVERFESEPEFKKRSFKSCFLLIAQRLTKYGVLIDQIFKHDCQSEKENTRQAWIAVDDFVRHVDTEMKKDSLNKQWEGMKKMLEISSKGKMLGRVFTYDDLTHPFIDNPRKVVLIGKCVLMEANINLVLYPIKQELSLVLFDDILVFFFMKGGKMYFFHHNHGNCVIPIKMMLTREVERTTDVRIIVTGTKYPEMYLLQFSSTNEIKKWVHEIQQTQIHAPEVVRRAPGQLADELLSKEDQAYNRQLETWEQELKELFDGFLKNEDEFPKYMTARLALMDNLRELYKKFPCNRILLKKDTSSYDYQQDLKHIERIQKEVSRKFRDIKDHRRKKLESLIDLATKSRDSDLTSFLDDLYEVHSSTASSSGESGKESSSNESQDETIGIIRDNKPRRVKTYHGTSDSTTEIRKSIKRHTTLPKMKSLPLTTDIFDEELEEDLEIQNEIQKRLTQLPLMMPQISRDAASKLIEENIKLRAENNKLKSTIAMQESHISSLKSRKVPVVETAVTHETLRQKRKELTILQKQLQEEKDNFQLKIQSEKERLATREDELKKRESDLEARIKRGSTDNFRSGAFVFHDNMIENQPKLKPKSTSTSGILALAAKTEVKRKR